MKAAWQRLGIFTYWIGWPFFWLHLHGSERSRVLVICGEKMLVVKAWVGDGKWSLPGGGIHSGEKPEEGALRELLEETGIKLLKSQLKSLATENSSKDGLSFNRHYFLALVVELTTPKPQLWEITEARWISISKISSNNSNADVMRVLELWKG